MRNQLFRDVQTVNRYYAVEMSSISSQDETAYQSARKHDPERFPERTLKARTRKARVKALAELNTPSVKGGSIRIL